jgi:hypothetical protein
MADKKDKDKKKSGKRHTKAGSSSKPKGSKSGKRHT